MGAAGNQIKNAIELLQTPVGMLGLSIFILLLVGISVSKIVKWATFIGLLYVTTLGKYDQFGFDHTLLPPIEQIRDQGRTIIGGLLIALLIPTLMSQRGWRTRLIALATVMFLLLEMVYSVRVWQAGLGARGLVGAVIYVLLFVVFGIGLSKWLQTIEDAHAVIRCLAIVGLIFAGVVLPHLLVNPGAMARPRFMGTTGNPQHAAAFIALTLPSMCYLLLRKNESKNFRLLLAAGIGLMVILLMWCGSRTGVLMTLIGLGSLFRARIKLILGAAVVCGIFVTVGIYMFEDSTSNVNRLVSTEDTRSERWGSLVDDFFASPLVGTVDDSPVDEASPAIKENSYLSVAARLGIIGMIPLTGFLVMCGAELLKLHRYREQLGEDVLLADLITGGLLSVIIGSCFEGFLLGTLSFWVPFIYIYLSMMTFLLDSVEVYATSDHPELVAT